jgi:hypothetical protein
MKRKSGLALALLAVAGCGSGSDGGGTMTYAGGGSCVYGTGGGRLLYACFAPPGVKGPRPAFEGSRTGDAVVLDGVRYPLSKGRVFLVDPSASTRVRQVDVSVPALVMGSELDWVADWPEVKKFTRRD